MIALDSNIILRVLVADDPDQTAIAEGILRDAVSSNELCFVSDPVLCEIEWVLDRSYRVPRGEIYAAFQRLLARASVFAFEDAEVFALALDRYHRGKADFSDFLIGAKAEKRGARTTFTFDRALARQQGFSIAK